MHRFDHFLHRLAEQLKNIVLCSRSGFDQIKRHFLNEWKMWSCLQNLWYITTVNNYWMSALGGSFHWILNLMLPCARCPFLSSKSWRPEDSGTSGTVTSQTTPQTELSVSKNQIKICYKKYHCPMKRHCFDRTLLQLTVFQQCIGGYKKVYKSLLFGSRSHTTQTGSSNDQSILLLFYAHTWKNLWCMLLYK
jgi:hypothetical protein